MARKIEVTAAAARQTKNPGPTNAGQIRQHLLERLAMLDDPLQLAKPLSVHAPGQFWRYRVGDFRLLCEINDGMLTVLVVAVGHRSSIYL